MKSGREAERGERNSDPAVSIVIPTHNRAGSLRRVLDSLACQTYDMRLVEVIVVVDGSADGTPAMLESGAWPLRLRVVLQEQRGVAGARNRAAATAKAPLLIFLDDDVVPSPELVEEHVRSQREGPPGVVIGRLAPDYASRAPGWWRWLEWQLDKQYHQMETGERPIDGRSLYSGNFSIGREQFFAVGGFDELAVSCEDTDLGLRLQEAGVPFRVNVQAMGHHCGYHGYATWRRMALRSGEWDGSLAVNMRYDFIWRELFSGFRRRHRALRLVARATLGRERLLRATTALLGGLAAAAGLMRLASLERVLYGGVYDLIYWSGVCAGLGGPHVFRRYVDARPRAA